MIVFDLLKKEDVPFLNEIRNECREYLHDNSYYTLEQSNKWFDKTNPEFYIINYDNTKIGYFRTSNLIKNESIYIGADLHKNYRGLGLAYKSYLEFIPFIKNKHNLKTLYLEVLDINIVAINLYKKLGFKIIEKNKYVRNGIFIENIKMKLLF